MILKTLKDINLKNKRVLVRVDYNISLGRSDLADQLRLTQSLATINYLLSQNCLVILISHLGRPKGKIDPQFSLKPLVPALERLLNRRVVFINDYLSAAGREKIKNFKLGEVILLENLRFYPGEEKNDPKFTKKLACLGQVFVNDGFGVSHRPHASVVGLTKFLPSVAGLLLAKEVKLIKKIIYRPQRPLVVVLGGAKTETKIGLINRLLEVADMVLLGGCLANTFLKARGINIGRSLVNSEALQKAKKIWEKASLKKRYLFLPADVIVGDLAKNYCQGAVEIDKVGLESEILDIGPKTGKYYQSLIYQAKTIIWNGPMGVVEKKPFAGGTRAVYEAVVANKKAISLVGGGDTLAAITQKSISPYIYLSTGGGAMLEFIEKGTLPGIKVLLNK